MPAGADRRSGGGAPSCAASGGGAGNASASAAAAYRRRTGSSGSGGVFASIQVARVRAKTGSAPRLRARGMRAGAAVLWLTLRLAMVYTQCLAYRLPRTCDINPKRSLTTPHLTTRHPHPNPHPHRIAISQSCIRTRLRLGHG